MLEPFEVRTRVKENWASLWTIDSRAGTSRAKSKLAKMACEQMLL
jgi:hypothetical protein